MTTLQTKKSEKLNKFALINAFLLSLEKDVTNNFYKAKDDFIESYNIPVSDHSYLYGILCCNTPNTSSPWTDYYVTISVFVDEIRTESLHFKLNGQYLSRFREIQDYVCKNTTTTHKIPPKIIEELNTWSKEIISPKIEEERQKEQSLIQKAKEKFEQEEQALSIYR